MRLTIDIPVDLHAKLKARAKAEGTTMRAIILRGLERELDAGAQGKSNAPGSPLSSRLAPAHS